MRSFGIFLVLATAVAIGCSGEVDIDVGPGATDAGVDAAVSAKDASPADTGAPDSEPEDAGGQDAADGGKDAHASDSGGTCNNPKQTEKFLLACQACLESKCCNKLSACFDIVKQVNKLDCNDLTKCVADCRNDPTKTPMQKDECGDDCADPDANTSGVVDAYNDIVVCAGDNCAAECD